MSDDPKPDKSAKPWARLDGETPKAREAFWQYLELGPGRSLRRLAASLDKPEGYRRQLERWSSRFDWPDRADAYDDYHLDKAANELVFVRQAAIAELQSHALDGARRMWELAEGKVDGETKIPILDRRGRVVGHKPIVMPSTRLQALIRCHESIGIIPPKRVEHSGGDGDELRRASAMAKGLPDAELEAIVRALEAVALEADELPDFVDPPLLGPHPLGPTYSGDDDLTDGEGDELAAVDALEENHADDGE